MENDMRGSSLSGAMFNITPMTAIVVNHTFKNMKVMNNGEDTFQFKYSGVQSYDFDRMDTQCINHTPIAGGRFVAIHLNHAFGVKENGLVIQEKNIRQQLGAQCSAILYTFGRDSANRQTNEIIEHHMLCTYANLSNQEESGYGWAYTFPNGFVSQNGDCMSPLVDKNTGLIIGFHVGGTGSGSGFALAFGRDDYPDKDIMKPEGLYESRKEFVYKEVLPSMKMIKNDDDQMVINPYLHPRDCVNFLPSEDCVVTQPDGTLTNLKRVNLDMSVFGSCDQVRSSPKTEIVYYPYVKALERHGVVTKVEPPRHNSNRDHAAYLSYAIDPASSFDRSAVIWAKNDYLNQLFSAMDRVTNSGVNPFFNNPIDIKVALNGIPGSRFIRRINTDTSSGLLLAGTKIEHLLRDENGYLSMTDYVERDFYRVLNSWRSGQLTLSPVKTALKDQAVTKMEISGKKKIRVFNVYQMSVFLASKVLLAPILHVMNALPLDSEQYQNVHIFGDEWKQIADYISWRDVDDGRPVGVFDGDFSKLDQNITGYMIREVGDLITAIAKKLGYSEEDQIAVRTITRDLATTLFFYNGAIFALDSVNTSGNLLTVFLNAAFIGIGMRVAYYEHEYKRIEGEYKWFKPSKKEIELAIDAFCKHIRAGYVGDDSAIGTKLRWFNQQYLQHFWERHNMKFTDGKKSIVPDEFSTMEDLVLCKRKFRYKTLKGKEICVAPLDHDSIWRSLQCHKKSDENEVNIWCDNVTNALRSFAFHDREVFEENREILRKVLNDEDCMLIDSVPLINRSYDEWWDIFYEAYYCDRPDPSKDVNWEEEGRKNFLEGILMSTECVEVPYTHIDETRRKPVWSLCTTSITQTSRLTDYHDAVLKCVRGFSLPYRATQMARHKSEDAPILYKED
jgi:hypothetical protein